MGNQSSSANDGQGHVRSGNPFRKTGKLGLTREELDRRCKPSGLYESCTWDSKTIRRMIGDGKIAARLTGTDDRLQTTDQECPICFLHYSHVNTLSCCRATICTECFLQVQNSKCANPCPFCNKAKMTVKVCKSLDDAEVKRRDEEEQKMIEASIRAKFGDHASSGGGSGGNGNDDPGEHQDGAGTPGTVVDSPTAANEQEHDNAERSRSISFGSNLDADLQSRSRSRTLSSSSGQIVAMTPEERRALEEEMISQRNHPLVRQMSLEAEMERQRHESEYRDRTRGLGNSDRRRRLEEWRARIIAGNQERRDFNARISIVTGIQESDDEDSEEQVNQRLDDLFMLEWLYLSSMNDRNNQRSGGSAGSGSSDRANSLSQSETDTGNRTEGTRSRSRHSSRGSRLIRRDGAGITTRSTRRGERSRSSRHTGSMPMDPEHIFDSILRERDVGSSGHSLMGGFDVMEMSEATQLEMAIQLSLQEAQAQNVQEEERHSNASESNHNDPSGDDDNGEDDEEVIVDHGEEEIVFEIESANNHDASQDAVPMDQNQSGPSDNAENDE